MPRETSDIDPFDSYNERLLSALNKATPKNGGKQTRGTPFDSYAGRLADVLGKQSKAPKTGGAVPSGPATPFDSYAGRLGEALAKASGRPAADVAPAAPEAPPAAPATPGEYHDVIDEQTVQATAAPVGGKVHRVGAGECLSKIAFRYGFFWQTIWNDGGNGELKQRRRDPNVLHTGDDVVIPKKKDKSESGTTETTHRFRRKGEPSVFRMKLSIADEPRVGEPYEFIVKGQTRNGVLDDDGGLEEPIPTDAKRGMLYVGETRDPYPLEFSRIDPSDSAVGVQQRLRNLGHKVEITGELDDQTRVAIAQLQKRHEMEPSGEYNADTKEKLEAEYGC